MQFLSLSLSFLSLLSVASAATLSDADVITSIASTQLQFAGAGLVPEPISQASIDGLRAALNVSYGKTDVEEGALADLSKIQTTPKFTLSYPSSFKAATSRYTAMYVDAGAAGAGQVGVTRHMLANNLTLDRSSGVLKNTSAPVTAYAAPYPDENSGPHRYMQLVFEQPSGFLAPANLSGPTPLATGWDMVSYVSSLNLTLVAATYIQVERGTAGSSASISSTSAVPAASVSAAAQSISNSIVAAAGATGTPSSSSGASGAAASGGSNGAVGSGVGGATSMAVLAFGAVVAGAALVM